MKLTLKHKDYREKFTTKTGLLTKYSFICGYIEVYQTVETCQRTVFISTPKFETTVPKIEIEIYLDGVYNVIIRDNTGKFSELNFHGYYDTIVQARKQVTITNKIIGGLK